MKNTLSMIKLTALTTLLASVINMGDAGSSAAIHEDIRFTAPAVEATVEPVEEEDSTEELVDRMVDYASTLLGRRYVWGATGPKSFDCSGFTSHVFRQEGIELPRTSRMQYTQGEAVDRDELKAGDLMFFSSPRSGRGRVGHVGIVVDVDEDTNQVTFIHASTNKGITYQKFPDGGYYSKNYVGAKRVITEASIV